MRGHVRTASRHVRGVRAHLWHGGLLHAERDGARVGVAAMEAGADRYGQRHAVAAIRVVHMHVATASIRHLHVLERRLLQHTPPDMAH